MARPPRSLSRPAALPEPPAELRTARGTALGMALGAALWLFLGAALRLLTG